MKITDSQINGPVIIGDHTVVENAHITPHTAIGRRCKIINCRIGYSIVMSDSTIKNITNEITSSLLGNDVQIIGNHRDPSSHRFILGDQSRAEID